MASARISGQDSIWKMLENEEKKRSKHIIKLDKSAKIM